MRELAAVRAFAEYRAKVGRTVLTPAEVAAIRKKLSEPPRFK